MNGIELEIMKVKGSYPIRFADDIMVLSRTSEDLEKAKERIITFLKPRGLKLNEGKTEMTSIVEGTDFLGYNFKEYVDKSRTGRRGTPTKRGIVIAKPKLVAIENFKSKIREIFRTFKKATAANLIIKLNPVIRG